MTLQLWHQSNVEEIFLIAGWRQWADAGSISSALPQYLIEQSDAKLIGRIEDDGFYLFQIPGTHDLVRPSVKLSEGYPQELQSRSNEFYYAEIEGKGLVIFLGDEPHLNVERYVSYFLDAVEQLNVKRVVALGGVYGELPYDKERTVSVIYSKPALKPLFEKMAVNLSNYAGGSSIGTFLCKRAEQRGVEYVGFYAFVPTYDFSQFSQAGHTMRIENDFMAWYGVMRRVVYMLELDFDLSDLQERSERLITILDEKVDELEEKAPQLGVRAYMRKLSEGFEETQFLPLDDVWEEELRSLFDDIDE